MSRAGTVSYPLSFGGLAPEIRCKISQQLADDYPTLCSLALVNKDWTVAARTALYKEIIIGTCPGIPSIASLWDLLCPASDAIIKSDQGAQEIASCIQSLSIQYFGPVLDRAEQRFWRESMQKLSNARALVSLTLHGINSSLLKYFASLCDNGRFPNSIQELHLQRAEILCADDLLKFLSHLPHLSTASISILEGPISTYRSIPTVELEYPCSETRHSGPICGFKNLKEVILDVHPNIDIHLASCSSFRTLIRSLCDTVPSVQLAGRAGELALKLPDHDKPATILPCITKLTLSINQLLSADVVLDTRLLLNVRELRLTGCIQILSREWHDEAQEEHLRLFSLLDSLKDLTCLEKFFMAFQISVPPRTTDELDRFDWSRLCAILVQLPHASARDSINILIRIGTGAPAYFNVNPVGTAAAEEALFTPSQLVDELRTRMAPLEGRLRLLIPTFGWHVMCEAQYQDGGDDENTVLKSLESKGSIVDMPYYYPLPVLPPPQMFQE